MKSIVFDTGPIISLTTNNLLWTLDYLKDIFKGDFYISPAVKIELVDRPLHSKRFKFEALQVNYRIRKGILTLIDMPKINLLTEELLDIANQVFKAKGNWLQIVHKGEMEAIATAIILNSAAVVIDERTTTMLVEDPAGLAKMLERKMGAKVFTNKANLAKIHKWLKNIQVLRSVELVMIAYEHGVLDKYLIDGKEGRKTLVDSLLWGVKIHGCAVSRKEIDTLVNLEEAHLNPEKDTTSQALDDNKQNI